MDMEVESMEMAPGEIPHQIRVPEQRLLSPESRMRWWQRGGTFRGILLGYLGFSRREASNRRKGEVGGGQGPHTTPRHGPGVGRT